MSFDENGGYSSHDDELDFDEHREESMLDDDEDVDPKNDTDIPPNTSFVEPPPPPPPPPPTESAAEPSAKRGRRGGGGGGGGAAAGRGARGRTARGRGARGGSMSDKLNRLLAKQRQETARDASAVLREALEMNTDSTLPETRAEASVSRQHCVNLLARLANYEALSGNASSAFTEHARLVTRINKAVAGNAASTEAALFEQCALALTSQSRQITLLRTHVDNLLRGFTDNIAKCDATARFAVARFFADGTTTTSGDRRQFVEAAAAGLRVEEPGVPPTTAAAVVSATSNNSNNGLHLRVGPFGEQTFAVSTREGVQTVRGAPGASYVMLSLARERGGVQMQAQTEETRHLLKQKRQAVERRRQAQFRALVNPSDALLIEGPSGGGGGGGGTATPLLLSSTSSMTTSVPLITERE